MILLQIQDVKECMSKLLLSEAFDSFLFLEGEIVTYNTFTIDGYLKKEFFEAGMAPSREYSLWKEIRAYAFSIIKGKRTPLSFKFIFSLSEKNIEKLLKQQNLDFTLGDVRSLCMNIKYDGQHLQCITGTSMNLFTLDKSLEQAWDEMVKKFFTQKEIEFEVL